MAVLKQDARQHALDFPGPFQPALDNFLAGDNSALLELLWQQLQHAPQGWQHAPQGWQHAPQGWQHAPQGWHFLHGNPATGKTHLLWAVQAQALKQGLQAVYLPLGGSDDMLQLLQQLNAVDLLLLDDAETLCLQQHWQPALFDCLQRAQHNHTAVIIAGRHGVAAMHELLADLRSRLATMTQHRLLAVPDRLRSMLVRQYLQRYAIPIADEVLAYLLARSEREQAALLRLLQRLVNEVLQNGQALTRPRLRRLLHNA